MPERDRDQLVDQMLRRVMRDDAPPQEECLDGETIAAWSEGTLRGAEASAVERHVSGCARCRALMASFIQSTPAQPVSESLWRRWHLGWAVPLATAATAVAIWVALPNNAATPVPAPLASNTVAGDESARAEPRLRAEASQVAAEPLDTDRAGRLQQEKAKVAEPANELRQRGDAGGSRELADQRAGAADAAKTIAAPPQAAAPVAGAAASPAAIQPAAPPQAAATAAERAEADGKKESAANSAFDPLAVQRRGFVANQIASPDGSARWRIVSGQQLERSTDAGAQWTPVTIASPERLIAGAAPSAAVCWIVGARGAVYVTTDGTRFVRLPFTEMVDLTSVFASDALTATVSSADGRSWRTVDQGRTWSSTR